MINKGSHVSVNARELADMFAELQELRRSARGAQPQQQKPPIYNRAALTDADARLKRLEMEKAEFQGTKLMEEILACAFKIQNLPFSLLFGMILNRTQIRICSIFNQYTLCAIFPLN